VKTSTTFNLGVEAILICSLPSLRAISRIHHHRENQSAGALAVAVCLAGAVITVLSLLFTLLYL
jgi:hypothetical protein